MPGLASFATHTFGLWLAQELIKNSRDSEQGVGKRLQMAFLNLAEKQLLDAEKVAPCPGPGLTPDATLLLTLALTLTLTLSLTLSLAVSLSLTLALALSRSRSRQPQPQP